MIIFTYEDYLKNILKLDISSVFLKKVLSKEDEEEEYEEGHTTECTLCDVSEKYILDSPDEIDKENKNNNTKRNIRQQLKARTRQNIQNGTRQKNRRIKIFKQISWTKHQNRRIRKI